MSHTCHAAACEAPVPPAMFMCRRHWRSLPKPLRDAIWQHYRPGQERDKVITAAYSRAAQEAIKHVAAVERRSPSQVREACLVYKLCEESTP